MKYIETQFRARRGNSGLRCCHRRSTMLTLITEFTTKADDEMQANHELGDKGANPAFMTQGLNKQRFIMGLPTMLAKSSHYTMMTAQVGKVINMSQGPMPSAPQKQLSVMKNDDVLKGVSSKFVSLSHVCFQALKISPLLDDSSY